MTPEQRQALEAERTDLARKLAKRIDQPGFAENAQALTTRIADIDELIAAADVPAE